MLNLNIKENFLRPNDFIEVIKNSCLALSKPKWINGIISNTAHRIFFPFSIFIDLFKYETIVRSSTWSFRHSDPYQSSVVMNVRGVSLHRWPISKPSLKIRTANAIFWISLGIFRDYGLKNVFLGFFF